MVTRQRPRSDTARLAMNTFLEKSMVKMMMTLITIVGKLLTIMETKMKTTAMMLLKTLLCASLSASGWPSVLEGCQLHRLGER